MSSATGKSHRGEEEGETQLLNAEEVTLIATNFLRRLGNKRVLRPVKASLQEEGYVVEIELRRKIATVEIDATSEEIKEYEIKDKTNVTSSFFPLTRKNILFICGIVAVSILVSGVLGVQSFLPSLF